MYKLLFVIPGLKTGGTNSSLSALYSVIKDHYEITIFPLSNQRNSNFSFDSSIVKPSFYFSSFHGKSREEKWYVGLFMIVLKIFRTVINTLFGIDIIEKEYKRTALSLESKYKFDYVIAFEESYPTKFVSYFHVAKKIAWIHCNYNKYCPVGKSEEDIYKKFMKIICVSKYTTDIFTSRYPSLISRTDFIYNIINTQMIIEKSKLPIEDNNFDRKSDFIIVSAGRIDPVKRFSSIPIIAKELENLGLNFKWYILGPISVEDEFRKLQLNIYNNNLGNRVIYLGNKTNPYNYFANSDLYVCTSDSEACPMVFNEAMILNKPVISSKFGSASEFIENGKNGFICELDEIASKIFYLFKTPGLYDQIREELKDNNKFNDSIIRKINSLFS